MKISIFFLTSLLLWASEEPFNTTGEYLPPGIIGAKIVAKEYSKYITEASCRHLRLENDTTFKLYHRGIAGELNLIHNFVGDGKGVLWNSKKWDYAEVLKKENFPELLDATNRVLLNISVITGEEKLYNALKEDQRVNIIKSGKNLVKIQRELCLTARDLPEGVPPIPYVLFAPTCEGILNAGLKEIEDTESFDEFRQKFQDKIGKFVLEQRKWMMKNTDAHFEECVNRTKTNPNETQPIIVKDAEKSR